MTAIGGALGKEALTEAKRITLREARSSWMSLAAVLMTPVGDLADNLAQL